MSADQHIKAWMHPNGSVITPDQKATAIAVNNKVKQWAEAFDIPLYAVGAPAQEAPCLDPHGCEQLGCARRAEIVRLREQLKNRAGTVQALCAETVRLEAERDEARAKVERLRAQVAEFHEMWKVNSDGFAKAEAEIERLREMARERGNRVIRKDKAIEALKDRNNGLKELIRTHRAEVERLRAEAAEREALTARILRCRYPVCKTIKPSGHDWDIPRLDEVIEAIRAREPK
ncbi:MAG: hypothetical protein ING91_19275 [Rhodocyclaceae bacterium]|nr:hypothetical protein [Rhodocyclaceae bacterium]MCA3116376.1 hypothetical protein [Rhodocyclaceae bacterium]MCA3128567.1 hypothetical protein [Rhodocyclaceae bacterium]